MVTKIESVSAIITDVTVLCCLGVLAVQQLELGRGLESTQGVQIDGGFGGPNNNGKVESNPGKSDPVNARCMVCNESAIVRYHG